MGRGKQIKPSVPLSGLRTVDPLSAMKPQVGSNDGGNEATTRLLYYGPPVTIPAVEHADPRIRYTRAGSRVPSHLMVPYLIV